jgi:diguanylate cyclase (GGDEF)-like protein
MSASVMSQIQIDGRTRPRWNLRVLDALEPSLGELEPAYRRSFLRADADQAAHAFLLLTLPLLIFAFSDYLLLGFSGAFQVMTIVRLAYLGVTLAVVRQLRQVTDASVYDRAVLCWSVMGMITVFTVNAIRPPAQSQHIVIEALMLLAVYLMIPNRLEGRLSIAGMVTVGMIGMYLSGRREMDLATANLFWGTIAMTNIMGLSISSRLYTMRRQQFLARIELERAHDNLHTIATTDALTGLLTRRRFLEVGEDELERARRYGRPFSLIAIDLDHFKQVNDRYGHAAGDAVLAGVAGALREQTRQHDLVGRIGGEELAVALPETGLETARLVAERIRARVSRVAPTADGVKITVTASFGLAVADSSDASVLDMLKRADQALYRAKRHGRDRVEGA